MNTQLPRVERGAAREGFYVESLYNNSTARHYIVIQANKFSVYGFGVQRFDAPVTPGTTTKYPITLVQAPNGTLSASHREAAAGTVVTVRVAPGQGYRLNAMQAQTEQGAPVTLTAMRDGTYTFTMPRSAVIITATFAVRLADPDDTGVSALLNTGAHSAYMRGYVDGSFAGGGNITRAEVAQLFYNLLLNQDVPRTTTFDDVAEDAWYAEAVYALAGMEIVNGVGDGRFAPDRQITRAEFAAIVARFAKPAEGAAIAFSDVPESHWAHGYIATASAYGWVSGVGDGRFAPNRPITRGEAATLVNHMLGRLPDKAYIDANRDTLIRFPDLSTTFWAYYDIIEATNSHDFQKADGNEVWEK